MQIALLLDNSGSMSGLINQARTQMWRLVNEFAHAKQCGRPVRLELALYEYGEQPRQLVPLTTNLDAVSEQLFGLDIRGGDEYCGQVILKATRELAWSTNPDDVKLIYISGNEPFTQGPVAPRKAIDEARERGIVVNVIHAGGADASWQAGAMLAGTPFMMINHNAQVATVVAPQDAEIARLGTELNKTYVGYGSAGAVSVVRQQRMDAAAQQAAPAALAERTRAKASMNYRNSEWDLVDAMKDGKAKLESLSSDELPDELKKLTDKERAAYVAKKAGEREQLQKRINELATQRDQYLAEESKKQGPAETTLDKAMVESVRREAGRKALTF